MDRIPLRTEHYDDQETALAYYAGLRCFGVAKEFVEIAKDDDGGIELRLYSPDGSGPPAGFPTAGEYLDAKRQSYIQAVSMLGNAMMQITGWPCQYQIRYSDRAKDYVFSADVSPLHDDPQFKKKTTALDKMFRNLYRETRVQAVSGKRAFDDNHPLKPHGDEGISYEIPLSGAFLKLGHSETLAAYLPKQNGGRGAV
jgi:hypothetical protein